MSSELLIDRGKLAVVQLTNAGRRVRLALWLGDEYGGGDLARFGRDATVLIEGLDNISASYSRTNWLSGIADGALYACRALNITRQRIIVMELTGRLSATDMEAVACAAAIAVSTLAHKALPKSLAHAWACEAHLTNRSPAELDNSDDIVERTH